MKKNNNIFGLRLKELRANLKLTQREMAEKVGITPATLSAYENGTNQPSFSACYQIATSLDVSLDWLCGIKNSSKSNVYSDLSEAFEHMVKLFQMFLVSNVERDDYPRDQCRVTLQDSLVSDFLLSWYKVEELFQQRIIDATIYKSWLSGELEKYKKYKITELDGKLVVIDPDLPF